MKKTDFIKVTCAAVITAAVLTGCGSTAAGSATSNAAMTQASAYTPEQPQVTEDGSLLFTKSFGSYSLPQGWIESAAYSTNDKFYYLADGTEKDEKPDNISVNQGTCRYTTSEATSFGRSIAAQLTTEVGDTGDISGSGTYTEADYLLLKFTITSTNDGSISKQYYIMADYKYCLINLSNYDNSDAADAAARKIVDSFKWSE